MQPIVLVTGASGAQGGATARQLLQSNAKVHALVRDKTSTAAVELQRLGAKLFAGDFDNLSSLAAAAAAGATAVFINVSPTPTEPDAEVQHARNIIQAAKDAGAVVSVVFSSVTMTGKHESFPGWGPNHPMGWYWTSKADIETLVRNSGIPNWTILRPAYLMHNYHLKASAFLFPELAREHTFRTAYKPDSAMTVFDQDDVGKFASAAFLNPEAFHKHEIDLGTEMLTPSEIVRCLSQASGKEIVLEFYPDEEVAGLAEKNPIIMAQLWANDVGYQVDLEALKRYPIKRTTFAEYLARHQAEIQQTFG